MFSKMFGSLSLELVLFSPAILQSRDSLFESFRLLSSASQESSGCPFKVSGLGVRFEG